MIAFATYSNRPNLTPDDQLAADALARHGQVVTAAPWDNRNMDWSSFSAIIIRSTWNYHTCPAAFLTWLGHLAGISIPVWNPPHFLRWNADKRYLLDLASGGVPTISTTLLSQGSSFNLAAYLTSLPAPRAVIKPTIAAGAYQTFVTSASTLSTDQSRLNSLLTAGNLLIQPFLPEIATLGEWSLLFFNGVFSHAVHKLPAAGDFRVQTEHGGSATPATPPPHLIAQARQILKSIPHPLLYARIDGLDLKGAFTLMELEALEPYLFFASSPAAPDNFARALLNLIAR